MPPLLILQIFADFVRDYWTSGIWIRMRCIQSISSPNGGLLFGPDVRNGRNFSSLSRASYSNAAYLYASPSVEFHQHKMYPRLVHNARKSERCSPVYASGKKGNSTSENTVEFFMIAFSLPLFSIFISMC